MSPRAYFLISSFYQVLVYIYIYIYNSTKVQPLGKEKEKEKERFSAINPSFPSVGLNSLTSAHEAVGSCLEHVHGRLNHNKSKCLISD